MKTSAPKSPRPFRPSARLTAYLASVKALDNVARELSHVESEYSAAARAGHEMTAKALHADLNRLYSKKNAAKDARLAAARALRWVLIPAAGEVPAHIRDEASAAGMSGVQGAYVGPCYLPRVTPAALAALEKAGRPALDNRRLSREELYAVILFKGAQAGRIVVQYPRDGAGTVYMRISFHAGPFKSLPVSTGSAGGYGYDKLSAALGDAMDRAGVHTGFNGEGMAAVESFLKLNGYSLAR